jgi:hypothetical protein
VEKYHYNAENVTHLAFWLKTSHGIFPENAAGLYEGLTNQSVP